MDQHSLRWCLSESGRSALCLPEREARIGGANLYLRQSQFLAHDIRPQHQRYALVKGDSARQSFASEPAVRSDDQALGRNILERLADQVGDEFRRLDGRGGMIDDADRDLLAGLVMLEQRQVAPL